MPLDARNFYTLILIAFELVSLWKRTSAWGNPAVAPEGTVGILQRFCGVTLLALSKGPAWGGDVVVADERFYESIGEKDG